MLNNLQYSNARRKSSISTAQRSPKSGTPRSALPLLLPNTSKHTATTMTPQLSEPTLSTSPPEILLPVASHLEFPFMHYLWLTSRALFALLPPTKPTLHELRCFEVSPFGISKGLLLCNSCKKTPADLQISERGGAVTQ